MKQIAILASIVSLFACTSCQQQTTRDLVPPVPQTQPVKSAK